MLRSELYLSESHRSCVHCPETVLDTTVVSIEKQWLFQCKAVLLLIIWTQLFSVITLQLSHCFKGSTTASSIVVLKTGQECDLLFINVKQLFISDFKRYSSKKTVLIQILQGVQIPVCICNPEVCRKTFGTPRSWHLSPTHHIRLLKLHIFLHNMTLLVLFFQPKTST